MLRVIKGANGMLYILSFPLSVLTFQFDYYETIR